MPLTRAGFANVPEVPLSGRHLRLERPGPLTGQEPARQLRLETPADFCCFEVRRIEGGERIGVALAHDLDAEAEAVSMTVCMDPELAGPEAEAEAVGLLLNYLFELHRFREVRFDLQASSAVAQLVGDLTAISPSIPVGEMRLSFAQWRAKRRRVEQMCGLPPRPEAEEHRFPWEAELPNEAPGHQQ